jgi:hypothetical protein
LDERAPLAKDAPSRESGTLRYDLEMESRKLGWGDPALLYGEDNGLSRFRDGRCTFSRVHADWALLRKRDQTKER